jgi:hypothetical protein
MRDNHTTAAANDCADAFRSLLHLAARLVPRIHARYSGRLRHLSGDFEDVPEAVVMETAHCGEVGCESFAVACLKLLDEELYVCCFSESMT